MKLQRWAILPCLLAALSCLGCDEAPEAPAPAASASALAAPAPPPLGSTAATAQAPQPVPPGRPVTSIGSLGGVVALAAGEPTWLVDEAGEVIRLAAAAAEEPTRFVPPEPLVALARGEAFVLGLSRSGSVWAFSSDPNQAKRVRGPATVRQMTAGAWHADLLTEAGEVWEWDPCRWNDEGALRRCDPASLDLDNPAVLRTEVALAEQVAAGGRRSVALAKDGSLVSWGQDSRVGAAGEKPPTVTQEGSAHRRGVTSLVRGDRMTLLLTEDEMVHALYDVSLMDRVAGRAAAPLQLRRFEQGCTAIAAASSSWIALDRSGTVWRVGAPSQNDPWVSVEQVPGLPPVRLIGISGGIGVAVDASGGVWSWSERPGDRLAAPAASASVGSNGPRVDPGPDAGVATAGLVAGSTAGTIAFPHPPVRVPRIPPVSSVGSGRVAAVIADGSVWVWEADAGHRARSGMPPYRAASAQTVVALSAGMSYPALLNADGTVSMVGPRGQPPRQIAGLSNVIAVATGSHHLVTLHKGGTVSLIDQYYALRPPPEPVSIAGLAEVTAVAAGSQGTSAALAKGGHVWSWRHRSTEPENRTEILGLRQVAEVPGAVALAIQGDIVFVLDEAGTVTRLGPSGPEPLPSLPPITAITGSWKAGAALDASGRVWTWGTFGFSKRNELEVPQPAEVAGLPPVVSVAVDPRQSLAVDAEGGLWVWGPVTDCEHPGAAALASCMR